MKNPTDSLVFRKSSPEVYEHCWELGLGSCLVMKYKNESHVIDFATAAD